MGWGANTLKSWKMGHGFEKVETPWYRNYTFIGIAILFDSFPLLTLNLNQENI